MESDEVRQYHSVICSLPELRVLDAAVTLKTSKLMCVKECCLLQLKALFHLGLFCFSQ